MSCFASFRSVFTSGFAALSIKLRLIAALWQAPATRRAALAPSTPQPPVSHPLAQRLTTNNWQLTTATKSPRRAPVHHFPFFTTLKPRYGLLVNCFTWLRFVTRISLGSWLKEPPRITLSLPVEGP